MFTGLFKTKAERLENVIINTSVTLQVSFVLAKIVGISTLTWIGTFSPIAVLIGLIVSLKILARLRKFYLQTRDTLDLIRFQRANKAATKAQNGNNG